MMFILPTFGMWMDDTFLFCKGEKVYVEKWHMFPNLFENALGLTINMHKSVLCGHGSKFG